MKKYLLFIGVVVLFACNDNKTKEHTLLEDSLAYVNANMQNVLKEKDSLLSTKEAAMTEFVNSFNEIQGNLNEIKAKEKIISTSSKGSEFKKSNKDQVISDVNIIYDLLNKNRQKVSGLRQKLKDSNLKIDELNKAIDNLVVQLTAQEAEISDMKTKLESLHVDFANLEQKYSEEKISSEMKTEKLNTAYYVIGTRKELKKNGIITRDGGFVGLGKVMELSSHLDPHFFTKIDISKTMEIPAPGNKVELITPHPDNSYQLVEGATSILKLKITNPEQFWSISKYLIIVSDMKNSGD